MAETNISKELPTSEKLRSMINSLRRIMPPMYHRQAGLFIPRQVIVSMHPTSTPIQGNSGIGFQRIEYIDFAKGFAILSIVVFHFSQAYVSGIWGKAVSFGGCAVHLFFVLSGFGLGLTSLNMPMRSFYQRRFIKILLPYFLFIVLVFVINHCYPIYPRDGFYALAGHLLLFKMFDERIFVSFGFHLWFISTIIQFYLVFPLLVRFKQRFGSGCFLGASLLVSVAWWLSISILGVADLMVFNASFIQFLWEFSLGIVFADLLTKKGSRFWEQDPRILIGASVLGAGLTAFLAIRFGQIGRVFNDIPAAISYVSLSSLCFLVCDRYLGMAKRLLIHISGLSYELYLIHMLVLVLVQRGMTRILGIEANIGVAFLMALPMAILLAKVLHLVNASALRRLGQLGKTSKHSLT
jgi:peptidoglycan/LPS O-acetylase OafA/YrhL